MEAAAGPSSTSVCVSAAQNELTELQKLLSANGDPDDADVEGITALYAACQNGHESAAALLLKHGARPDRAVGVGSVTPLLISCSHGHDGCTRTLLGAKASARHGRRRRLHATLHLRGQRAHRMRAGAARERRGHREGRGLGRGGARPHFRASSLSLSFFLSLLAVVFISHRSSLYSPLSSPRSHYTLRASTATLRSSPYSSNPPPPSSTATMPTARPLSTPPAGEATATARAYC